MFFIGYSDCFTYFNSMQNLKLLSLLESVLGKGKSTSGDNIAFFSPFINHYKPKLEINLKTGSWHCWVSDAKGRSIVTLFKKLNLSKDKFEQLQKINSTNRITVDNKSTEEIVTLPSEYQISWQQKNTPEYRNAIRYLQSRNVSLFDMIRYRIGYCDSGEYSGKIIIPSYDELGRLNYFISRAYYAADSRKHKNPKVSKDIVGFEMLINWEEPIVICEGAFDAIAIKRNAIPLFGKVIPTSLQKKIIEMHVKDIYICLDSDALKNAVDIAEQFMNEGLNVYFIKLTDKDPSELGYEAMCKLIKFANPMTFENLIQLRMELLWK